MELLLFLGKKAIRGAEIWRGRVADSKNSHV